MPLLEFNASLLKPIGHYVDGPKRRGVVQVIDHQPGTLVRVLPHKFPPGLPVTLLSVETPDGARHIVPAKNVHQD